MDIVEVAKLGAQVCLDVLLLWLVIRYLPKRDEMFAQAMQSNTKAMNRLTNVLVSNLTGSSKERLEIHDKIMDADKE